MPLELAPEKRLLYSPFFWKRIPPFVKGLTWKVYIYCTVKRMAQAQAICGQAFAKSSIAVLTMSPTSKLPSEVAPAPSDGPISYTWLVFISFWCRDSEAQGLETANRMLSPVLSRARENRAREAASDFSPERSSLSPSGKHKKSWKDMFVDRQCSCIFCFDWWYIDVLALGHWTAFVQLLLLPRPSILSI